ncbi:MAG: cytochrome P450 [Pedobacter sp.]|uniref:cytochrome P450 n=1 Tax=Pedobacter sp. TaxID=1411316 RepID=UPI003396ED55
MVAFNNHIYPPGPDIPVELDAGDDTIDQITKLFRQFGNIYKVYSERRKSYTYVINDPEMIKHVLITNNRNYTKGVGIDRVKILLGNGIMGSEGEYWKKQRRMVQPAFHRKVTERLSRSIVTANQKMAAEWGVMAKQGEAINLTAELSRLTLNIVLQSLFSTDLNLIEKQHRMHPFMLLTEEHARDLNFALKFRSLASEIRNIMQRRAQDGRTEDDFLSMLMTARDPETGEGMSDKEIIDELLTLIVAGHETTASALNWAWYLLATHPQVYQQMKLEIQALNGMPPGFGQLQQLGFVKQVIDETMRMYPPGWLLTRKSITDDQIGRYHVPAKTDIFISPFLMHRHPDYWENPEQFMPDRFSYPQKDRGRFEYFPFGGGPRQCIGDYFAQVEMQLHLAIITQKYDLQVVVPEQITMEARINLRNPNPLYTFLSLRK